jgi:hypothetical protein
MTFFKKYNGTTNRRLARLETVIWTLIYGGLLLLVVGLAMERRAPDSGNELMLVGSALALVGTALVYLRSRLHEGR